MALKYNGTEVTSVNYNGASVLQVNYNGTPIWYALQSCSISGTAEVDNTLTATVTPSAVQSKCSFQWYRANSSGASGSIISGATSRTYKLTSTDRTKYIYCVATIGSASKKSNYSSAVKGWHSWTTSKEVNYTDTYTRDAWVSITIPSNATVSSISVTSWCQNHAPDTGNVDAENRIYLNESLIKTGSRFGGGGYNTYTSTTTHNANITSGTIRGGMYQYPPTGWHCGTKMVLSGQIFD